MEAIPESQTSIFQRTLTSIFGRSAHPVRAALLVATPLAGGLWIRLAMLREIFSLQGDPLIYGGLAKNLLLNGHYSLTTANGITYPTLIRLPGYPLFMALCFRVFGMENYVSVCWIQIALDLAACLLLADFARRIAPSRLSAGAALATLWLASLCPFTASYTASPMAETPTLFAISLALWALARFHARPGWPSALWFTFAVTFAALLRPDGALVGVALAPALVIGLSPAAISRRKLARIALVCILLALTPFAVWTARNWNVFHVFEPLAPRLANDPDEDPNPGWERWVKTWCLDFASTYQIYWNVPGDVLDSSALPSRAYDSPAQRDETTALIADYNKEFSLTPELDERFARLANERVASHPLRFYLWLPLGRLADMIFRPRVENLNIDIDWWVYAHHKDETRFSWAYAALNVFYLIMGITGLCLRPRFWPWMLAYLFLRSALLLTVEAPETRYTLEYFPILCAAGGISFYWLLTWVLESVAKLNAPAGR